MKNPKIVFFDIDDTLYRKETDVLRPCVTTALFELKQRNIITAIATGRTLCALPKKISQLIEEVGIDLLVTINGQYNVYRGEPLQSYSMPKIDIERICTFFDKHSIGYGFVTPEHIVASHDSLPIHSSLQKILPDYIIDKQYFHHHKVYQMLAFYERDQDQFIAQAPELGGYKAIRWHQKSVDLLTKEGSKARGINHAIQTLGINMKDVMAFGDGLNDLEMMQAVGFSVAMGNGHPQTKALADYICPSVEEDGVLKGLKALGVIA